LIPISFLLPYLTHPFIQEGKRAFYLHHDLPLLLLDHQFLTLLLDHYRKPSDYPSPGNWS
jgi:hypothetical protein